MATEDARYRLSSQYRLCVPAFSYIWSFSRAELASLREKSNSLARASISERFSWASSSSDKNNNDWSASTSNANTPDPDGVSFRLPEFLTVADQSLMTTFYTTQLLGAGSATGLSDEICATAAAFFRRFYITNSIMTYSPQDMMTVALFFACKAEGWFTMVTDLKKQPVDILAGEFLFCQGIRFAIDVRHPFCPLIGARMELRRLGDIKEERIRAAEERAKSILRFSSLIMLAALSLADCELAKRLIQETFHYITSPATNGTLANGGDGAPNDSHQPKGQNKEAIIGQQIRDKVLGTIEACREMMAYEMPERSKEHWQSKKLKKCCDPDRSNLVALQRARREEAFKKGDSDNGDREGRGETVDDDDAAVFGEAARDAKIRKVAKGLDDPFGGPL
ncbi:hypothetical protein B0T26DRAFT_744213 [Lasiosphaeria miniovina]|uniref:Cyclin C-terminal domain-containing protein n=1 Tax=Lasiosphaeria miniovina TaxID=1954250 RepID=A0AA39ZT72_9PEZI|nr:uncharacterized protein B0T26DRAFT_744213 [Lasiosphaeria miniovina]KAK0703214.1 hypothetical protein B0T26DRAFT_744213 [Lasiosphaeria miniovina]